MGPDTQQTSPVDFDAQNILLCIQMASAWDSEILANRPVESAIPCANDLEEAGIMKHCLLNWRYAWLDPRKDEMVIAPKQWFVKSKASTQNLIPTQWLRR